MHPLIHLTQRTAPFSSVQHSGINAELMHGRLYESNVFHHFKLEVNWQPEY